MSRRCMVTGKSVMVGHNVSHANNKTKRRFMPNLQVTSLLSDALGRPVRIRLSTRGLRTIEHNGGLDAWILNQADSKLDQEMRRLKRQIAKAKERRAGAPA
jgi:large subunit ribosomal protein L28